MAQNNIEPVDTNAEMFSLPAQGNGASRRTRVPRTRLFYEVSFDLWKEYKTWGEVPEKPRNDAMTKTGKTDQ